MPHLNPAEGTQKEYAFPVDSSLGVASPNYVGTVNPTTDANSMILVVCVCNNFNSTSIPATQNELMFDGGCFLDGEKMRVLAWDGFRIKDSNLHTNFPTEERTAVVIFGTPVKTTGNQNIYLGVGGDNKTIVTYGIVDNVDVDKTGQYYGFPGSCVFDSINYGGDYHNTLEPSSGREIIGKNSANQHHLLSQGFPRGMIPGDLIVAAFCSNEMDGQSFNVLDPSSHYPATQIHHYTNTYMGSTESSPAGFTAEISMAIGAGNWDRPQYNESGGVLHGAADAEWGNAGPNVSTMDSFVAAIMLVPKNPVTATTTTTTTTAGPEPPCTNILPHYIWGFRWDPVFSQTGQQINDELIYGTGDVADFESKTAGFTSRAQELLLLGQISNEMRDYYESLAGTITLKTEIEAAVERVCGIITGYDKTIAINENISPKVIFCFNLMEDAADIISQASNLDKNDPFQHIQAPAMRPDGTSNWDPSNTQPAIPGDDPVREVALQAFPKVITINIGGAAYGESGLLNDPVIDFDGRAHSSLYWVLIHEILHGLGFNSFDFINQSPRRFQQDQVVKDINGNEVVPKTDRCSSPAFVGLNGSLIMSNLGSSLILKEYYDNYEAKNKGSSDVSRSTPSCCPAPPDATPCKNSRSKKCDVGPPYYGSGTPWKDFSEIYPIGRTREEAGVSLTPKEISYADWYWRVIGDSPYIKQFMKKSKWDAAEGKYVISDCGSGDPGGALSYYQFLGDNLSTSVLPNTWLFGQPYPFAANKMDETRSHAVLQFQYIYSTLAPPSQISEFTKYMSSRTRVQESPPYYFTAELFNLNGLPPTMGDLVFGVPLEHRVSAAGGGSLGGGFLNGSNGSHWSGSVLTPGLFSSSTQEGSDGEIYERNFQDVKDAIYHLSTRAPSSKQDWWISDKFLENSNPDDEYGETPRRKTARVQMDPFEIMTFSHGGLPENQRSAPSPISKITVGAMRDLGYTVNYFAADPFYPNFNPLDYEEVKKAEGSALESLAINRGSLDPAAVGGAVTPPFIASRASGEKLYRILEAQGLLDVEDDEKIKERVKEIERFGRRDLLGLCCAVSQSKNNLIRQEKNKKFLEIVRAINHNQP